MPADRPLVFAVDDEEDNLELWRRVLGGHELHCFTQPRDALEAARSNDPDAFVLDYRMPELSGIELTRALRRQGNFGTVLLVTAYGELTQLAYAEQERLVMQVIAKPVDPARLREWVTLAIERTRLRRKLGLRPQDGVVVGHD